LKLPRISIVLETEEESGSPNLIKLLHEAKEAIGNVDYCLCMDSGVLNYD
jgi:acetylornithine deacetylase/succinyl-diaminopimelate desuccinylase-like protein